MNPAVTGYLAVTSPNGLYLTNGVKYSLVRYLIKNYKENLHYIIEKNIIMKNNQNGGQNKINYFLTEEAFELLNNTFNLRNRYIVDLNDNIKQVKLCMPIENQTIGFIENTYKNILNIKRQFRMEKYRVDLYFIDYKLVIECD